MTESSGSVMLKRDIELHLVYNYLDWPKLVVVKIPYVEVYPGRRVIED